LEEALSPAVAWSLSACSAFVRPGLLIALLLVLAPVCLILTQSRLHASGNTITVNNTTDPASTSGNGFCTLREAINNANAATDTTSGDCAAGTGTDTIKFSVSGTITLGSTLPAVANTSPGSLTIDGSGRTITIDGANSFQVLDNTAALALNDLTIAHGDASSAGGVIENGGTTLTITNCTFSNNLTTVITNEGSPSVLTVANSIFSGNTADEGIIFNNGGTLTVTNSTFSGNTSTSDLGSGGIINGGMATVDRSTFSGNSAPSGSGGAIRNEANAQTLTITNSTFSGNSALGPNEEGGAIFNHGTLTITNSTFSGNSTNGFVPGAIFNEFGTVTLTNSILANGASGGNCGGGVTNGGFNISDDNSCGFGSSTAANGDTIGDSVSDSNLALDPAGLANNGGPTQTIELKPGSYAIDAVPLAHQCPATDQRGLSRPEPGDNSGACDIGAVESTLEGLEKLVVNPSKINFGTVSVGTTGASQPATITSEFNDDNVDLFATFITANFIKTGTNCPATLGPLQSCQVSFACKPKTTGSIIGAYAFLYGSWEASVFDADDFRKIGVVQFTCTGS
jgi:hypothetical protein